MSPSTVGYNASPLRTARLLRTVHSLRLCYARLVANPAGHAAYALAVEKYKALLAEWEQHVSRAKRYSEVCLKLTKGAKTIPRPRAITALGELSPLASLVLGLLFSCRRRAARVVGACVRVRVVPVRVAAERTSRVGSRGNRGTQSGLPFVPSALAASLLCFVCRPRESVWRNNSSPTRQ